MSRFMFPPDAQGRVSMAIEEPTRSGRPALVCAKDVNDYVTVSAAALPREFEVTFWADDPERAVHVAAFEVINGQAQCVAAGAQMRSPNLEPVGSRDLRAVRIDDMLEYAIDMLAQPAELSAGMAFAHPALTGETRFNEARRSARNSRNRVTPEHLRGVAAVYEANITDAPVAAVATDYGVSRRTASLWVKKAREAGYITEMARKRDA